MKNLDNVQKIRGIRSFQYEKVHFKFYPVDEQIDLYMKRQNQEVNYE